MSPVHVLQMSPVQVLQVQSSPCFTTCPEETGEIVTFVSGRILSYGLILRLSKSVLCSLIDFADKFCG